jgi:hypothetical protein
MPNFTMLAQNTDVDYVQQACLAAMSIQYTNPKSKICLITNDQVPSKYKELFEHIVEIPWGDHAAKEEWKVSNRWKIIHATPFDETFVLDTDMLVLDNIDTWWTSCQTKDLYYTSQVKTYKDEIVNSRYYRRAFDKFNLPDIYSGIHYFKKNENTFYFYKWLEYALNNWEKFQGDFAGGKFYQKVASVDLTTSIITKVLGLEQDITNSSSIYPTFTHMKLHCQNWQDVRADRWQDVVGVYLNNSLELKIGNFRQRGIFHYTEDDFVTDNIIKTYEKGVGI